MKRLGKISFVCILLVSLLPAIHSTSAQDEDDPLQKVLDAEQALATYDSFVMKEEEASLFSITVDTVTTTGVRYIDPITITVGGATTVTHQIILGDTPNVLSNYYYDNGASEGYNITAEVRYVEGGLYVNAVREDIGVVNEDLGAIPDGWTLLEVREDWPGLDVFEFGRVFDSETNQVAVDLFDETSKLFTNPTDVSVTTATAEDGTELEVITLILLAADFESGLMSDGDPEYVVSPDSSLMAVAQFNEAGQLVSYGYTSLISETKEVTENFNVTSTAIQSGMARTITFSDYNSALAPAEAPVTE